jgi:hypothetical protein
MRIMRVHPRPVVLALPALLCLLTAEASSSPRARVRADLPIGGRLAAAAEWPLDVQLEFRAATFGFNPGAVGLHAVDLDADNAPEIVTAARAGGAVWAPADYWYVLSHRGAGYRQTWVSPEFREGITSLAVGALDGDAAPEILVATGDEIHVYDGATRARQWTIDTAASEISDLQVADLDSDGALELAFCSPGGLYIYDAVTGAPELSGVLGECLTLGVGQLDHDAALELALGNGPFTGYVLDGVTRSVQWEYPLGFGHTLRLGDVDGDGPGEIVAAGSENISVLDVVAKVEENTVSVPFHSIEGLLVADVEGDDTLEVIWGAGATRGIHVLDGATLQQKWEVDNADFGITNLMVADTDEDAVRELWWGAGTYLYALDAVTREVEWRNLAFYGPFYGLAYGDVEGDGRPDFLFTSFRSELGATNEGLYFVYGAVNKRQRYVSPGTTGENWSGLRRIQVANVDGDPQLEVLVASGTSMMGVVVCYDGLSHAEQWRAPTDGHAAIWSLQVADVDADGHLEAVFGGEDSFVYVVDAATGAREWRSPHISGGHVLSLVRLAQLDGDPALEILVAEYGGRLLSFDGVSHTVSQLVDGGVTALAAPDRNGDGRAEVVVGTNDGEVRVIGRARRRPDRVIGRFGARIDGLAVADLDGDGIADYVFAADGTVRIVQGGTRATLWQSEWIGAETGYNDSLLLADIDRDGRLELMVNTGHVGVDIYEVPAP